METRALGRLTGRREGRTAGGPGPGSLGRSVSHTEVSMSATWVAMTWLHQASIVALLGYYATLALVVLPGLSRSLDGEARGRTIGAIGRRSRPMVIGTVIVFLVSGTYLLVSAGRYDGIGNLFSSTWTVLLTIKHLVVLLMIVVAIGVDRLSASVAATEDDAPGKTTLGMLDLAVQGMTVLGLVVLLLTAAAQGS
jgi:uncharacterized membrane protein